MLNILSNYKGTKNFHFGDKPRFIIYERYILGKKKISEFRFLDEALELLNDDFESGASYDGAVIDYSNETIYSKISNTVINNLKQRTEFRLSLV